MVATLRFLVNCLAKVNVSCFDNLVSEMNLPGRNLLGNPRPYITDPIKY